MQAYAACDDPEICAVVRGGYGDLVAYVERVSGADPATISAFFATGMLMNVLRRWTSPTDRGVGAAPARRLQGQD